MNFLNKESFKMKRKLGVIPQRVWNAFVDTVFGGMITSVQGGRLTRTDGGGTTLVINHPPTQSSDTVFPSCLTPDKFIVPKLVADPVKVVFHPCEMRACGLTQQGDRHVVKYNLTDLSATPAPEIELADGDNDIWIQWETDDHGDITADSVTLTLTMPTGLQTHIPPSPGGTSQGGKYMQLAGKIHVPEPGVGATERSGYPTWTPIDAGLDWETFEREMINVGGEAECAKEITLDQEKFRTFRGKSVSLGTGTLTDVKITVTQLTDVIEIEGEVAIPEPTPSGNNGSLTINDCYGAQLAKLEWTNGLITTNGNTTIQVLPCGDYEEVTLPYCDSGTPSTIDVLKKI